MNEFGRLSTVLVSVLGLGLGSVACDQEAESKAASESAAKNRSVERDEERPAESSTTSSISLLEQQQRCQYFYRGQTMDLGDPDSQSRNMFTLLSESSPSFSEHSGESFRVLDQLNNDFVFWSQSETDKFELQVLVHGLESERMAAYVDGKRLGAAKLKYGETRVVRISGRDLALKRGRHRITLSLSRPKGGTPRGAVSWLRIGPPGTQEKDHAFTARQMFSEVTIGEQRQPSFIVQPGAKLRCPVFVASGTKLRSKIGIWGQGNSDSELAVRTADGARHVLFNEKREKDEARDFRPVEVDLSRFESQWVELEFLAHSSATAARSAFATPTLITQASEAGALPQAKRAIVVVLSGLNDEKHAPPQSGQHGLRVLTTLASGATLFPNYRVSTTSSTGAIASLLTGAAPWQHQLQDSSMVLPNKIPTLASAVEANGGRSSFFTGVPTSFANFGFDRGFELFHSVPPQKDEAATAPLMAARKWLEAAKLHDGPVLSFIHLRGAHPPFDVSKDEARTLPPQEYGGDLTPRRAAIQLSNIRARSRQRHRRMPEEDWRRVDSLQQAALLKQSDALVEFIEWLRKEDAYQDTLLIVVGDVGAGSRPKIPFPEKSQLDEDQLAVPLLVKFPGDHQKNQHVRGHFAPRDLTHTIAKALGIEFSSPKDGIDLRQKEAARAALARPHIALQLPEYSVRMGRSLLRGEDRKAPRLCLPEVDPKCAVDRSEEQLTEAKALWFTTWSVLGSALSTEKEPARIEEDLELENALTVWGFHR